MAVPALQIPELEGVLQHGSAERRARTLERVTSLFLTAADRFNDEQVGLFDGVLTRLIADCDTGGRAELARRLAPVRNAPTEAVRRLAHDDDIAVAGPVLEQSRRLTEVDLIEIANAKSPAHLRALAGRAGIGEVVTGALIRRGDRQVTHRLADNSHAHISEQGFAALVSQAATDGILAMKVAARSDIPARLYRDLLLTATAAVQQRLIAAAKPEMQAEIRRLLSPVAHDVPSAQARNYTAAERSADALRRDGKLDEQAVLDFAKTGQHETMVAALARLCRVPIDVVDRLMSGERTDPIVVLCKSVGWQWPTVKTLIMARPGGASSPALDAAFANFERLSPATAHRVMRFWQARPAGG